MKGEKERVQENDETGPRVRSVRMVYVTLLGYICVSFSTLTMDIIFSFFFFLFF